MNHQFNVLIDDEGCGEARIPMKLDGHFMLGTMGTMLVLAPDDKLGIIPVSQRRNPDDISLVYTGDPIAPIDFFWLTDLPLLEAEQMALPDGDTIWHVFKRCQITTSGGSHTCEAEIKEDFEHRRVEDYRLSINADWMDLIPGSTQRSIKVRLYSPQHPRLSMGGVRLSLVEIKH